MLDLLLKDNITMFVQKKVIMIKNNEGFGKGLIDIMVKRPLLAAEDSVMTGFRETD